MPYVGRAPVTGKFQKLDAISVVNNQAAYTMQLNSANYKPGSAEQLIVSVNGVIQAPGDAYTISGSTITFSENLVTGDVIDFIISLGDVGNTTTVSDGTIDVDKVSSSIMKDNAIRVNDTELASGNNVTIASDENAMVAGPFTLNATLTINGTFTVV